MILGMRSKYFAYVIYKIQCGEWKPGFRVPSARKAARVVGRADATISQIYAELKKEGILVGVRGQRWAGTFVAPESQENIVKAGLEVISEPNAFKLIDDAFLEYDMESTKYRFGLNNSASEQRRMISAHRDSSLNQAEALPEPESPRNDFHWEYNVKCIVPGVKVTIAPEINNTISVFVQPA